MVQEARTIRNKFFKCTAFIWWLGKWKKLKLGREGQKVILKKESRKASQKKKYLNKDIDRVKEQTMLTFAYLWKQGPSQKKQKTEVSKEGDLTKTCKEINVAGAV